MNYNIGDTPFTAGIHKGTPIKEIAQSTFQYLRRYLAFDSDCPEYEAIEAVVKGYAWINRPIEISDELILDSMRFAGILAPTLTHLQNLNKIEQDIVDGRIAEWVTKYILSDIYGNITPPDETVYVTDKQWKPNLVCITTGQEFSVHSQNTKSAKNNGESWVFSIHDPEFKGLCDPKRKECFVLIDLGEKIAKLRVLINIGTIHAKHLFKDLQKLGYHKKCVYYKDIEEADKCEL